MAAKTKTVPEIDDDAHYTVTMTKRLEINRNVSMRRGSTATFKGKVLKEYLDYVGDIRPVAREIL